MRQLDALTLRQLAREWSQALTDARLSKVQHLARHELTLSFWGGGLFQHPGRHRLYLNLGAAFPCAFLATAEECRQLVPEPLEKPTGLCMLLRKRLGSARCLSVSAPDGERVINLDFDAYDELAPDGQTTYRLSLELMGKHSNLLLVNARTQTILGAARYIGDDRSRQREIAPGLPYAPPPRPLDKPSLLRASPEQARPLFRLSEGDALQARARLIQEHFWGLGGAMLQELLAQSADETDLLRQIADLSAGKGFAPAALIDDALRGESDEKPPDFRVTPPLASDERPWRRCDSVQEMTALAGVAFWTRCRVAQARQQTLEALRRRQRRLEARREELADAPADDLDALRAQGDRLLTALAMGALPPRPCAASIDLPDLETGAPMTIAVDPALSWRENAERYYRRLKKARARRDLAKSSAQALAVQEAYLNELTCLARQAQSLEDFGALQDDLRAVGAVRQTAAPSSSARKRVAPAGVQEALSDDGMTLLLGRSALGNAAIVGKLSRPDDYWLHARDKPGAHVLIKTGKQPPSETAIAQAAQLAARFSAASSEEAVDVVMALMRHVRKIPDSYPGHVTYRGEQTLRVRPDPALAARLLARAPVND